MQTDGRANMTKLIVSFRNFGSAPEKLQSAYNYSMQDTQRQRVSPALAIASKTDLSSL